MSTIDNRNLPPGAPGSPQNTEGYGAKDKAEIEDDSKAWSPSGKPAGNKGGAAGAGGKGEASGKAGAKGAAGAQGALGTQETASAKGVGPAVIGDDPSINSGVLQEKPRTGMAALSEPPPMPPSAIKATPEHVALFSTINNDMHEAMTKGLPANQPNLMDMHAERATLDTSTPQGQARADQLDGRMKQTAVRQVKSLTSGDGLAAFLALAVGFQDKNKNLEGRLNELTQKGRETAAQQEKLEQEAQAKAAEKAEKKAEAMKFLKPLLAVITVALTIFSLGSATGVALACMGAMAGFFAGGAMGGKKDGSGFSFSAAMEGAATGFGAAGIAGALKSVLTRAVELGSSAATKAGTLAGQSVTQRATAQALEGGAKQSAEASSRLAEMAKTTQAQMDKVGQNVEARLARMGGRAQEEITKGMRAAGVKEGGAVDNALGKVKDTFGKLKEETRLEFGTRVADTAAQVVGATSQFMVDQQRAKATLHEAQAKLIKVIEECMKQQGERGQDAVQGIVNGRKASFDNIEGMLKSRQQAASNAISGIGR